MGDLNITKCGYRSTERIGLYIMVFLILLNTCDIDVEHGRVMKELKTLKKQVELIQQPIEETDERFKGDIQKSGKE